MPAPGGGGNKTPAPLEAAVLRDRGFDDVGTGTSNPSADFFA